MAELRPKAMAVGVALVALCSAGCSSTTSGNGSGSPAPSAAGGSAASGPSTGGGSSRSFTPSPAPPPVACPGGTCKQNMSATLSGSFTVVVRTNPDYQGGKGAIVLELTDEDVPISWYVLPGETPVAITCSSDPRVANCVLVDTLDAARSDAIVWRLTAGTLQRGSTVLASTTQMHALDLNHDGLVDAAGLQNSTRPGDAGKVYWQTWLSDGLHLATSGCTQPAAQPPAVPSTPERANCP